MTDKDTADDGEEEGAQTFMNNTGPNKNKMTDKWLPDADHWLVKTFLDRGDAGRIVGIHATAKLNPETNLDELNEEILPKHYEGLVSEDGAGFENYQNAIEAMHGGGSGEDGQGSAMKLVAPEE